MAKLHTIEILEIRALLADGITGRAIARRYNVDEKTVSQIKLGRYWRSVQPPTIA